MLRRSFLKIVGVTTVASAVPPMLMAVSIPSPDELAQLVLEKIQNDLYEKIMAGSYSRAVETSPGGFMGQMAMRVYQEQMA